MSDLTLTELGLAPEQTSVLPGEHVEMLAATLDVPFDRSRPLPLLWHWAFFNPVVGTSGLGADGHPRRESPLLVDFPRRMWVGGEVRSNAALFVGNTAVRRTRLLKHTRKSGSTGELLFVTLEHTVEQNGTVARVERQDIVYRQGGGVTAPAGPAAELPPPTGWREILHPTAALLFRFSAVTFNSHRIHYDQDYATGVEHYPGLVVHGPLTAMLLAGSAARHLGKPLSTFAYRASSALFVDQPVYLDGAVTTGAEGETATMTAIRVDGVVAMTATAAAEA